MSNSILCKKPFRVLCQKEMSDRLHLDASYLLLGILNFLFYILTALYIALYCIIYTLRVIVQQIFNVNMTEKTKKRKITTNPQSNQTVCKRGAIDANWQKLLSSTLMDDKKEKTEENKDHYTGTFRRARKKNKDIIKNVNFNNLNINNKEPSEDECSKKKGSTVKEIKKNKLTKFVAMDCEMVGVGYDGNDHMLARVSIVNKFGDCIYDKFVKAREEVVDYRTNISGIRKEDLLNGEDFTVVQKEVAEIIKGKILVGHSLKNDLGVLFLSHPKRNIRDTSKYKPFRKITKGSTPSLKRLAKEILNIDIQHGEHSSIEDAKAAMQLYCTVAKNWEQILSEKKGYSRKFVES